MSVSPISSASVSEDPELYVLNSKETLAETVRRMQANARVLAREQVEAMNAAVLELAGMAREVAVGGEAYPVGVRELSRRMADELGAYVRNIEALLYRP
jgi:hypothetical protein